MNNNAQIDVWFVAAIVYITLSLATFIPVLKAIFKKVKLLPGGSTYDDSPYFTKEQKERLNQHYSRMNGTLEFWKNRAAKHNRFHLYTMIWTTIISITLPILIQAIGNDNFSKILLTIISLHSALLFGFHRAFKVEKNYQSFRIAESEFFDLRRSFLDDAYKNQQNMDKAIDEYFEIIRKLRIMARKEEIDNTPVLKEEK